MNEQPKDTGNGTEQVMPFVELIAYTPEPLRIVNIAARRCYSGLGNDELSETLDELTNDQMGTFISGVKKSGHLSVIEHAAFTFAVEGVSRALLAQITRSRIASFSVQSQRYVTMDKGFGYVIPPAVIEMGDDAMAEYAAQMETISDWYKGWVGKGLKPEDARYITPQATETKFVFTMNARELLHFFELRCCNRAQWEIKWLANRMLDLCQQTCPEIFKGAGPSCVAKGLCSEGKRGCGRALEMKHAHELIETLNHTVKEHTT